MEARQTVERSYVVVFVSPNRWIQTTTIWLRHGIEMDIIRRTKLPAYLCSAVDKLHTGSSSSGLVMARGLYIVYMLCTSNISFRRKRSAPDVPCFSGQLNSSHFQVGSPSYLGIYHNIPMGIHIFAS